MELNNYTLSAIIVTICGVFLVMEGIKSSKRTAKKKKDSENT